MTEQELTDSLRLGEWVVDTSPHRYKVKGKTVVRYEWEAVSKDGTYKKGFALTQEGAEDKAQKWADVG